MLTYHRNINNRLIFLWIVLLIALLVLVCAIIEGQNYIVFFAAIALFAASFIRINKLMIGRNSFELEKSNLFGLRQRTWTLNNNEDLRVELFKNKDIDYIPETDTILDAVILFIPFYYIKQGMKINWSEENVVKSTRVRLSEKEFALLEDTLNVKHSH